MRNPYLPSWANEPWVSPALRAWLEISAATAGTIGIDEPGTIDKTLDTNTVTRGGTQHREIINIGDDTTAEAFARVLNANPADAGTDYAMTVRQIGFLTTDFDTGAGDVQVASVGIAVAASGGPAVITGDVANGLDVDVTRVTGTVTIDEGANPLEVVGDEAHDAPVGGNPVLVGGYAADSAPTAVGAGDAVRAWHRLSGAYVAELAAAGTLYDARDRSWTITETVTIDEGANPIEIVGDAAHDAPVAGNPVLNGAEARSSSPTAVGNGDAVRLIADLLGKQIILPFANTENFVEGLATLTGTGDVSIIGAAGVGVRNYVTEATGSNTSGTAVRVDIKDGTTIKRSFYVAANGGGFVWSGPNYVLRGTANTAVQMALSAAVTDVRVGASGYTAP